MTDSSDAPKPPAPAPIIEVPLGSWVKGGTISSAYEKQRQQANADADKRRRQQDAQFQIARNNPTEARMRSLRLGGQRTTLMIVLEIQNSDRRGVEWITCELWPEADGLVLNMACPECGRRDPTTPNFKIHQSHRRFELDTRRCGELWVNPLDPRDVVTLAGTIHLTEWVSCPGLGCTWRFKIDNSVLRSG